MLSSLDIVISSRSPGTLRMTVRGVVGPIAVNQLRMRLDELVQPARVPLSELVVDLSALEICDCRLLPVLHAARQRLVLAHGRLEVRGLDPGVLAGFADAGLAEVLAVYRASIALAGPQWPREPGWAGGPSRFSDAEQRLIGFGAALAAHDPSTGVAVTERLLTWCVRVFGVRAAVVLVTEERAAGGLAVVCASDEGARLVAVAGIRAGEGPVVECLQRGRPACALDLDAPDARPSRFTVAALRHDVRAVRGFPLRVPETVEPGMSTTVGVLVVLSAVPGAMAPTDLQVLEAVSDLAGTALARDVAYTRGAPWYGTRSLTADLVAGAGRILHGQAVGVVAEREQLAIPEAEARLVELASERGVGLDDYSRLVVESWADTGPSRDRQPVGDGSPG